MELTIDVERRRPDTIDPDVLFSGPVEVEGLESPEQFEHPLYIRVQLKLATGEAEAAEPVADAAPVEAALEVTEPAATTEQQEALPQEPPPAEEPTPAPQTPPAPAPAPSAQATAGAQEEMGPATDSPVLDVVEEAVQPAPEPPAGEASADEGGTPTLPVLTAEQEGPLLEVEDAGPIDASADNLGEFQQQASNAASAIESAEVTFATIRQEGIGSMYGAGGGAGRVLDPKPVPKKPPRPTEADPVPHALWQIDKATVDESGKNPLLLAKIDLPKMEPTPQGNVPKRGDRALSDNEFAAVLKFGKEFQNKADQFTKQFDDPELQMSVAPQQSLISPNGLSPEEEHVRDVYDTLKNGPKPEPPPKPPVPKSAPVKPNPDVIESKAEPLVLPPLRPEVPEDKEQDARQREAVAQTFARLLAEPDSTASEALAEVANMIAPGGVVHRKFPDLGEARHKSSLQAELEKSFREMAIVAGASQEQLDKAVADRKREIAEKASGLKSGANQMCYAGAQDAAQQAGAVAANADSNAQAMKDHAKKVKEEAAKMTPTEKAIAKRDELIAKATAKAAAYNSRYQRMKESRKNEIAKVRGEYLSACGYAEQKDELQIREKRDLTPEKRQDEITASKEWLKNASKKTNDTFDGFNTAADTGITGFITAVNNATSLAYKEIRQWAATKTGLTISSWQEQQQATADWEALTQANADAFKALETRKAASVANYYIDYYVETRDKQLDQAGQETELANKKLGQDKRAIASALFGKSGQDPLDLIAKGIRDRFMDDKREKLRPQLRSEMMQSDDWEKLSAVGVAIGPVARSAEALGRQIHDVGLHGGVFGRNEVGKVMGALSGLNDVQNRALELFYVATYDMTLDYDLRDQLDKHGEYDRAKDLIKLARMSDATGKEAEEAKAEAKAGAAAAEIYAAGEGQVGTDEDTIYRVLRGLDEKARERVERIYLQRYGHSLSSALEDEMSGNEAARGQALRVGDKEKADAIAVDDALNFRFWGPNREDAEKVYADMKAEIVEQARREGRDSEWVRVEAQRRAAKMELIYDTEIAGKAIAGRVEYDEEGQARPYVRPKLRDSYGKLFGKADSDVLIALADGDEFAADAARIEAERQSFIYVSDNKVNDVLMAQYDRARKDEELDSGRALRYMEEQRMRNEEERDFAEKGRFWAPDYRYQKQQELELKVERAIDSRAEQRAGDYMRKLSATYENKYPGHSLQAVVTDNMGGNAQTAAQAMLNQGYLTPYQRLRLGIEGAGTKEKLVKDTLKGRTKEEIAELDALWQLDHPGETLFEALSGDLSGDDWIEAQISYQGRPMTVDEAVELERFKEVVNRAGSLGRALLGSEDAMVESSLTELENLRDALKDPKNANLTPDEQQGLIDVFNAQREVVNDAVELRNTIMNQVTDSIVNVVSIVVAVVVGAVGSLFTGGLAGAAAIALIASILTTATSIGLRAALTGGHYGLEQLGVDLAIGVVDAIVAVLTAGMGNRLLGIRQVATAGAKKAAEAGAKDAMKKSIFRSLRQMMAKNIGPLAEKTRAIKFLEKMAAEEAAWYSRLAAHGMSQAIENTVQSIPSALVGQALDEKNYEHGNAFFNIVSGAGQQVATSVAQGLALSGAQHVAGVGIKAAWNFAKGPQLGSATYKRFAGSMSEPDFEAHYKDYEQAHPGATREDFGHVIDREQAATNRKAQEQVEQRDRLRQELDAALSLHDEPHIRELAGKMGDVPITQLGPAEFARVAGIGAPDVVFIVKDGQVHIIAREGASPASIKQIAADIATRVEPGTAGRVKDANAALPKDLRGTVNVRTDPSLPPRQVEVRLKPQIEIVAGKGATAADIAAHARTARAQVRLEGARGRVLQMIERIRLWTFEHGSPPAGSRAFEAHFEVEKLPKIIEARQLELTNPDLSPHQRAHIEEQVVHLFQQLETHSATLKSFDLEPGRGFIAAEDIPHLQEPYKEALRTDVEPHRRTPLDPSDTETRSPLHGKEINGEVVERVNQVGEVWHEKDPKTGRYDAYRLVEGLDANGKRIALYEETFNVNDRWSMRGSEISGKGSVFEKASRLQLQESIRRARAQGRPDFEVRTQNESGQGFDKVRIKFEEGDVVRRGKSVHLSEDAAPTIVIGEDKLMTQVSMESITAIRDNLVKNLRDLHAKAISDKATLPLDQGGLGLTPFQAEALVAALESGKFRFELRVGSEESLGNPKNKTELQQESMILPRLETEIRDIFKKKGEPWMKGRDIEIGRVVIGESYQKKARAVIDAENRIGEVPSVHQRALDMGLNPSNPEHLHQAYVSLIGQDARQPAGLRISNPVYDPTSKLLFETGGRGRAIQARSLLQSDVQTPHRSARVAEQIFNFVTSKPRRPRTGRSPGKGNEVAEPVIVLDLSGVSPARREALKKSLVRLFDSHGETAKLQNVLFVTHDNPVLRPLVTQTEIASLSSSSPKR